MKPQNKIIKSSAVTVFVIALLTYLTNEYNLANIAFTTLVYTYLICIGFLLALYLGEKNPKWTTLFKIFMGIIWDYVRGKLIKDDAMKRIEILIMQGVQYWDVLKGEHNAEVEKVKLTDKIKDIVKKKKDISPDPILEA